MDYQIILRSASVYTFMVVAIRLAGKKELSQLSTTDLVFIILISNAVQNAMVGSDSSLLGGIVAASTLFIMNYILKLGMYKFPWLKKTIEAEPIILVVDGNIDENNLRDQHITIDELEETVREHGIISIGKVKLAMLEVDGNISVISNEEKPRRTLHKRKKMHRNFAGN